MPTQIPESNRIPINVEDLGIKAEFDGYTVCSWNPEKDGKGPSTQVHLLMNFKNGISFAIRMKTKNAVNQMIAVLEFHRNDVWP